MSAEIIVPTLGESVAEATIAKWYKQPGDAIKVDELLLELETEKVTLEVNATAEGVLEVQTKKEGDTVEPGEMLGNIVAGNGAASGVASGSTAGAASQGVPASNEQASGNQSPNESAPAGANSALQSAVQAVPADARSVDPATTMPPSARKLVAENNLNPASIDGSGKGGRITKGDVLGVLAGGSFAGGSATAAPMSQPNMSQSSMSAASAGHGQDGAKPVERIKMSRLRKTIAQRLKDSQNTAAILSTFNEIDMTNVIALRKRLRDDFQDKHGVKLGFMSFFVKAVTNALKEVPSVNAEIDGDDIIYKKFYDIGVAVGTEQGLVVPVVRGCDRLGFAQIEQNIADLAVKARSGKLAMSDLTDGTFSITNGGVYGSLLSTPIINPPQTGIIGLHNTQERPVVINGKVEVRSMMYIALSYDHRIIDGKDAVTFLVKVKKSIEDPERLMFDM